MALWGNNDAVTVTPTGKVSLAYTDAGYTNVNAAGIGSTGWVLTGTATSFGNPGYGKTGDVIAIGFPKNTLGVGTYYGEAVIVGIAATNQISIAGTEGLNSVIIGDTTGLLRYTGLGTMYQIRESPQWTHTTAQYSENSATISQDFATFQSIFVGTAASAVGVGTSSIFVNVEGAGIDPVGTMGPNSFLIVGTDTVLNDGNNIVISGIGTAIVAAGSSSGVGFSTIYVDTTQIPHIAPDHIKVRLANNAESGDFISVTGYGGTTISLGSTLPYNIGVGSAIEYRQFGGFKEGFVFGLDSGVTAAIADGDTFQIQRLHGGYEAHVYSVDSNLVGIASDATVAGNDQGMFIPANAQGSFKTSAGWVGVTTYIDNRGALRVKKEVLVAMSGITTGNYPVYDGSTWGSVDPEL